MVRSFLRRAWGFSAGAALLTTAACTTTADTPALSRDQRGDTLVLGSRGPGRWGDRAALTGVASFGQVDGSDSVALASVIALAEGTDGRIYATDGQIRAVRVFDAELRAVAIWGRDGAGPGELRNPDGGLAVFSDGRVAVRDPGNARLQLFLPDGSAGGDWKVVDPGLRTRDNFGLHGDTLLSRVVVEANGPIESWVYGLARIAPDGRVLDTIRLPRPRIPRPTLVARRNGSTGEIPLPFGVSSLAAWHPRGGFALADGDRFAITWPGASGLIRVERNVPAVAVSSAEAEQERSYVTKGLRSLDPAWTWNGPPIPTTKPRISQIFVGRDGSIWAVREAAAIDSDDPDFDATDSSSVERRLRSQLFFDAFTSDGDFLGSVPVPISLQLRPQPLFSATGITALTLDASGVPRLERFVVGK
jgi:hypothetical protein